MSSLREKVARAIAGEADTTTLPIADRAIAAVFDWLEADLHEVQPNWSGAQLWFAAARKEAEK